MRTSVASFFHSWGSSIEMSSAVSRTAFLLLWLLPLSACVVPPTQTAIPITIAARSADATRIRQVAVLPFETRNNVDVTAEVESSLAGIIVQDKPFFTVVERQRINELLKELKRQESGIVDPQTAVRVGKMLGVKGVYMGAVTRADATDSGYTQARQRCLYFQTLYDKNGKAYQGNCVQYQNYSVNCTKRVGVFSFAPKLVEVESGRIVYSRDIKGEAETAGCSDDQRPLLSRNELFDQAKRRAMDQFRRDVAPSTVTLRVTILESTEGMKNEAARQKFLQGVAFAKGGRLDRACELWNELLDGDSQTFTVAYNAGVCLESMGDYPNALSLYNRADRMLSAPNNAVSEGIRRVKADMENERKLKDQLEATSRAKEAPPAAAPAAPPPARHVEQMSVMEVQTRLLELGYQPGKPDGMFGRRTADALRKYQHDNHLPVTGRADAETMEKLRK